MPFAHIDILVLNEAFKNLHKHFILPFHETFSNMRKLFRSNVKRTTKFNNTFELYTSISLKYLRSPIKSRLIYCDIQIHRDKTHVFCRHFIILFTSFVSKDLQVVGSKTCFLLLLINWHQAEAFPLFRVVSQWEIKLA